MSVETLHAHCGDVIEGGPNADPQSRVLHIINGEHYSGAERVQDLLAGELPELGIAVGLACVKPNRFPQMRQAAEVPLFEVPMRGRFDFRPVRKLVRIVREHDVHLLHAHTPRTLLVARMVAARTRLPIVYHVHSPTSRDSNRRWVNRINSWTERACLSRVDRIITVSQSLADELIASGTPRHCITVVPNGVPAKSPSPRPDPTGRDWTLGTVALFRPRKGTEVLLDAMAMLQRLGVRVKLRAIGPFETKAYERCLRDHVERLGLQHQVEWTGFTRDVDAEFAKMDLFVLPSVYGEGMPMVVLEAMASAVPVVATRVEGVPEVVRDGVEGLLAEPGDAGSLAECVGTFVSGQISWESTANRAMSRQQSHFSQRSMAAGVANVYRQLVLAR